MIGNVENRKESGKEWVTESDYIFTLFIVVVQLLDEEVTVGVATLHCGG